MPRAKPSSWRPKGIEVLNTHDFYSDDDLATLIIDHLGTHSKTKTRKILVQLRNITGLLRAELYYRKRPTRGEKEKNLGRVANATRTMLLALEALDNDTRRLLENEADQSPEEVDIVINGQQVGYQVKAVGLDVHEIRCSLKVFEKWNLGPSKPPRKIKRDGERRAVSSLLKLWNMARAADPTRGAFTDFVNDVLLPVLKACNAETPLTAIISEALYGKKEPNKKTGTRHVPEK